MSEPAKMKICYAIEKPKNEGGKSYWHRIGVAFVNRDGSLTVRLQAFPVNGEMQIRDYQPRDGGGGPPSPSGGESSRPGAPAGYGTMPPDDDDIPF